MAKKTTPNYDNTLVGRYIRQIENPDSAGWKILPADKEHPLRVSNNVKGILDHYINENRAFHLDTDYMVLPSDRLGPPIYDAGRFSAKPYIDNNGNYFLKAFDKFDFTGTVTGGDFVENKLNKSHKYYPNSGTFVVRQDSIPIILTPNAEDENMFMDMFTNSDNY